MKRLIAAIIALALVAAPAFLFGDHKQAPYEEVVRWAECKAALVTSDEHHVFESFYQPGTHTLYIGTKDWEGLRLELAEMVLFHEIGHCLQAQAGMFDGTYTTVQIELDADRWSADLACAYGRDGRALLRELLVWAKEMFNYDGDPFHGTSAQRIAQGGNAAVCMRFPSQAPLLNR